MDGTFKNDERIMECAKKEFLAKGYTDASYGTRFRNFVDRLVRLEEEYTWKFLEATGSKIEPEGDKEFYHMMVTAYFEVVRHEMDREKAKKYISMMGKYHHAGFEALAIK